MASEEKEEKKEISGAIENLIDQDRVVGFSDAIFAFAATLLVLKIDLPQLAGVHISQELSTAIVELWPQYFANIISFLIIGYYWLNHHAIFSLVKRIDRGIVWLNIVFLIFLSFIPFPVDLYGSYSEEPVVIAFYSASLAIAGYFITLLWWYASVKHRLIEKSLSYRHIRYYLLRNLVAPVVFTLSIPLAFIDPVVSQFSWLFVLVGIFLVNRFFHYKRVSEIEKLSV